jgi:RHS repeat-associated protein
VPPGSGAPPFISSLSGQEDADPALGFPKGADFAKKTLRGLQEPGTGTGQRAVSYRYDALGRLLRRQEQSGVQTVEVTDFAYAGWQLAEERRNMVPTGQTAVMTYLYGGGLNQMVASRKDAEPLTFSAADDQGSIVMAGTAAAGVVERYNYDDFGRPQVLAPNGTPRTVSEIGNRVLYTGRWLDPVAGLYSYRTRWMSPELGRFTTRDTIGIWGDPANLGNGAAYVGNSPWNWVDPWGEACDRYDWWNLRDWWRYARSPATDLGDWIDDHVFDPIGDYTGEVYGDWAVYYSKRFGPHGFDEETACRAQETGEDCGAAIGSMSKAVGYAAVGAATERVLAGGTVAGGTDDAHNAAMYQRYKDSLRAAMEKPATADAELTRLMNTLYRPGARIGSGSTAAAVRHTRATGELVGGSDHVQKARDSIRALQDWLAKNSGAGAADRAAAENVISDLQNALNGK